MFYSPRTVDTIFFDSLNKNIQKALDTTNNIVIIGYMSEDLFNPSMHNLKDVLLINSLHNIIAEPTRQLALLDRIILHEDMTPLNQGIIKVPSEISDHSATYNHLNIHYMEHSLEMFKCINLQNMNCLKEQYLNLTGHVFIKVLSVKKVPYLQVFY